MIEHDFEKEFWGIIKHDESNELDNIEKAAHDHGLELLCRYNLGQLDYEEQFADYSERLQLVGEEYELTSREVTTAMALCTERLERERR